MASSDEGRVPQWFDVESTVPSRSGWSKRWAGVGAFLLLGAVAVLGRSPETPAPQPSETSAPSPVDDASSARLVGSDIIVVPTQAGVLAISAATGERLEFVLDASISSVRAGPDSSVILTDATGGLLVLDLHSQRVARVGEVERGVVEASIASDEPSATFLSGHRLLAVADDLVFGEVCDERRCRLEQRSSSLGGGLESDARWEVISPRPLSLVGMVASADGKWFTTHDGVLALYRTDRGGTQLVHTGALVSGFSSDGATLYILTRSHLEVIDLVGDEIRSVDIGQLPTLTGEAVVVAA